MKTSSSNPPKGTANDDTPGSNSLEGEVSVSREGDAPEEDLLWRRKEANLGLKILNEP